MTIRSAWFWPYLICLSAICTGMVTIGSFLPPVRALVTAWFLLVCPGMAFVRLLQLEDRAAEWTLAIALSLGLDAVVAIVMVYAGAWSPVAGLWVLIALSLVGAGLQMLRAWSELHLTRRRRGLESRTGIRRVIRPVSNRIEAFLAPDGTGVGARTLRLLLFSVGVLTLFSGLAIAIRFASIALGLFIP